MSKWTRPNLAGTTFQFDLQLFATPVGELTSLGVGKETTFGTLATPTLFHGIETFSPTTKNVAIPRGASRKRPGMGYPTTGPVDISLSLRPESTPDTLGQLLAYAMGTQSAPANYLTSTVAKTSTLTFGNLNVLPSFTAEYNRITDALDYLGCTIDQVKFALESAKGLTVDFTIAAQNEAKNTSPTTPTWSTKDLLAMEAAGTLTTLNSVTIGTSANPPAVLKWDLTLNNQLDKTYRGAGSGRLVYGFPLGQRKVSGSMTLGFESEAAQLLFWGSSTTGPGATVAGVPITFLISCQDYADPGTLLIPYSIQLTLPNCFIESAPVANVTSGALKQVVTFTAAETSASGNDLSIVLINTASAVY